MTICIYCKQPITFLDWLFRNGYSTGGGSKAHVKCRVEPKAGE